MKITDMVLVTENYKGTEINFLMNFVSYMIYINNLLPDRDMALITHTINLNKTENDTGMWTEVYFAANKSVNSRYCVDIEQLKKFLLGEYNDKNFEYYLAEDRCSMECLELLDELGINLDGSMRSEQESEREYAVEVREILSRVERVLAPSLGEAIDKVMEMYHEERIVLGADDFKEVEFEQEKRRGR